MQPSLTFKKKSSSLSLTQQRINVAYDERIVSENANKIFYLFFLNV